MTAASSNHDAPQGRWARASLLALLAPFLAPACSQGGYEGPYRHVLLLSLDTLRADHLSCYGGEAVSTPGVDALAAEGALFLDVTTAAM